MRSRPATVLGMILGQGTAALSVKLLLSQPYLDELRRLHPAWFVWFGADYIGAEPCWHGRELGAVPALLVRAETLPALAAMISASWADHELTMPA